ncbi:transporter substrate-binding domain-containing protein [Methylocystis sp. B8]|uniref:transporter substrate-binding domain-containing protein n=1 Tax=Methylocystis sp. B8 TaxID=544938 RepID=UPI0010FEE2E0|nr:transporter substrate-binding domain-containing protein [Methylocystis sp. B8]TLG78001.1 transporter substrate-binding domain-containing protein [Methylocystis sp. B8]
MRCTKKSRRFAFVASLRAALAALLLASCFPAAAAEGAPPAPAVPAPTPPATTAPSFWDPNHTPEKPDLSGLRQIRFLTEDDYPPFNFLLADGQVAGFNVDLARAICLELDIACTIQRRQWDLLIPALNDNSGDAIIASLAINDDTRKQVDFSGPYMLTPGRFVMQSDTTLKSASPTALADRPIAVVAGSRHEAFLKAFYPRSTLVALETPALARNALKNGRVQALFGDAISLSYWLNGAEAAGCCVFRDGPFTDQKYFGEGVGIAVKKGNAPLRHALDYALFRLAQRGVFAELYLKYFPVGPF